MTSKRMIISLTMAACLAAVIGFSLFGAGQQQAVAATAMAEFSVSNLSCGSCVSNIQSALSQLEGVGQVEVSVTSGRSQVIYDPAKVEAGKIAQAITEAGYPATVRLDLDAQQYQALEAENAQLSETYVARIGTRLVSRDDFEKIVQQRTGSLGQPKQPAAEQQLRLQVWQDLKQRELLLLAAEQNQVVVQDGEVELQIKKMQENTPEFDSAVKARFGSLEQFASQIKEDMIINRNIEDHVVTGITDRREQQIRFNQWYQTLQQQTAVVVFDPQLKQAETAGGSGCGGSCCG